MAKTCNQLIVMMMMEDFIDTILKIMKKELIAIDASCHAFYLKDILYIQILYSVVLNMRYKIY
jgi:hypothetical protein